MSVDIIEALTGLDFLQSVSKEMQERIESVIQVVVCE